MAGNGIERTATRYMVEDSECLIAAERNRRDYYACHATFTRVEEEQQAKDARTLKTLPDRFALTTTRPHSAASRTATGATNRMSRWPCVLLGRQLPSVPVACCVFAGHSPALLCPAPLVFIGSHGNTPPGHVCLRKGTDMSACAADALITALRAEGCDNAVHHGTDRRRGYSSVFVALDRGGIIITSMDLSAHHLPADHTHPWWARYKPSAHTSGYYVIYEGTDDMTFAADNAACARAVMRFIRERHLELVA
ncbi:hypothetical protein ACH4VR_36125 [Streptomyces sp. NPDC020883]|uniref:hypothetical protein n=1 Tax=Streptomyces sp. NPDC020883 TaxID=3365099 RepID=UPI00378746D2